MIVEFAGHQVNGLMLTQCPSGEGSEIMVLHLPLCKNNPKTCNSCTYQGYQGTSLLAIACSNTLKKRFQMSSMHSRIPKIDAAL